MKDDSDYRSLTPKPGWLQKSCERCEGNFWLAPGQFDNIRYCKDECRHEPPEVRFWKSVTKDGPMHPTDVSLGCCWNSKFTPSAPYPSMKVNGETIRVARFILELTLGRPITKGLQALHSCDNTRCVNQGHIYEGTQSENIQGCVKRGRHRGNRTLTLEQVNEIKSLKGHATLKVVAEQFKRSIYTIWCIWNGRTWKNY